MVEIILARHGETRWNVGEVFRGRADIPLNENGQRQAALLGRYLETADIRAVHSSPLKRALDTAKAIASPHALEVTTETGLLDLDFGEWEGLTVPEVKNKYGELFNTWASHPEIVRLPGGETLDDVRQRALQVVNRVVVRDAGTVVLVTHRVVIKVLVCALLGLDNSHFWNVLVDTCGLTTFRLDSGRFILVRHNDNSFLRALGGKQLADF